MKKLCNALALFSFMFVMIFCSSVVVHSDSDYVIVSYTKNQGYDIIPVGKSAKAKQLESDSVISFEVSVKEDFQFVISVEAGYVKEYKGYSKESNFMVMYGETQINNMTSIINQTDGIFTITSSVLEAKGSNTISVKNLKKSLGLVELAYDYDVFKVNDGMTAQDAITQFEKACYYKIYDSAEKEKRYNAGTRYCLFNVQEDYNKMYNLDKVTGTLEKGKTYYMVCYTLPSDYYGSNYTYTDSPCYINGSECSSTQSTYKAVQHFTYMALVIPFTVQNINPTVVATDTGSSNFDVSYTQNEKFEIIPVGRSTGVEPVVNGSRVTYKVPSSEKFEFLLLIKRGYIKTDNYTLKVGSVKRNPFNGVYSIYQEGGEITVDGIVSPIAKVDFNYDRASFLQCTDKTCSSIKESFKLNCLPVTSSESNFFSGYYVFKDIEIYKSGNNPIFQNANLVNDNEVLDEDFEYYIAIHIMNKGDYGFLYNAPTVNGEKTNMYIYNSTKDLLLYFPFVLHTHNYTVTYTKEPTCSEKGYSTYTCLVCGDSYNSDYLDATGKHKEVKVKENEVSATYDKEGSYDEIVYCSLCGKQISKTKIIVPKLTRPSETGSNIKTDNSSDTGSIIYVGNNSNTNSFFVKGKTVRIKYKSIKKKKNVIKINKAVTVNNAKGLVTYKLTSAKKGKKNFKKYFKIIKNKTITVKKGLKKGTYKIKVKITDSGNSNNDKNEKSVTVTVIIK
ncbi:MAG: hypothetical protein K6G88_01265 [Lachnospiraceae bacterium]|nr:hypothetical protein [Lachnospiraceae bacterium]